MLPDFESLPKVARSSMNQHHKEEVDAVNQLYIACKEGKEEEIESFRDVCKAHRRAF